MKEKTFKQFMENQSEYRIKLFNMMKENPISMRNLSDQMGIGINTLIRFLREEKDVDFVQLTKIEKWIKKNAE